MIIAKNDEEKRSKVWRIATLTATGVIIIVAVYFLFTLFAGNPLEGTWASEDSNLQLTISDKNTAIASWAEDAEAPTVKLSYTLDKGHKTITFKVDDPELQIAELDVLETTLDYSLDKNTLTLAEREYGEQMVFVKK